MQSEAATPTRRGGVIATKTQKEREKKRKKRNYLVKVRRVDGRKSAGSPGRDAGSRRPRLYLGRHGGKSKHPWVTSHR